MTVNELIEVLLELKKDGKGDYKITDDGYLNEILKDDIRIDEKRKEVIL